MASSSLSLMPWKSDSRHELLMKTGRNDPCPCGSGNKFKRCCARKYAQSDSNQMTVVQQESIVGVSSPDSGQAMKRNEAQLSEDAQRAYQLGNTLAMQGKMSQAVDHYERALSLRPNHVKARHNLGNALVVLGDSLAAQGRLEQAVAQYERALSLRPDYAEAHNNLGNALMRNRPIEAIAHFQRAISLQPNFAEAHNNLALVLSAHGQIDQAIGHFERALLLKPDYHAAHSNFLLTLNYASGKDPLAVYAAHLDFARRWEEPLAAQSQSHPNDRSSEQCLKIGYVSSDFRQHSVAYFIEPVLESHDRERFEIFCYSNHPQEDGTTARLIKQANHWRKIAGIPDDAVAKQVRADRIDILVDLNGHTANNRLLVFARKPAPVQVTWLGYPNTTGLSAMDYRITDAFADPVGKTEHLHSEKLVRLPECFSCYLPPREAPEVSELPAQEKGYITFGSFNKLTKISPEIMAVWARIILAIPGSRLTLKNYNLSEKTMQEMVLAAFARLGVPPERLQLLGDDPSQMLHLKRYQDIDIGLDPFPYNGTTTTCEALWMGVPVITLAGRTHAGRVGVSQMTNLGMTDLVSQTPDEYVATAVRLASDMKHLGALRKELRPRMLASPLMDASRFTANLEQAYLAMWKNLG